MSTTPVFAEILVLGMEVEAWLVLLILTAFGTDWVDVGDLKDFAALVTIVVLALAYILGIIVDRLADTVLDSFERTRVGTQVKRWMTKNKDLEIPVNAESGKSEELSFMRMTVMFHSDGLIRFLDYQRSRWRVARGTVVNIAIGGLVGALYIAVATDQPGGWALVPPACALVLLPISYFAAVRIQDAWVGRLVESYLIVKASKVK